LVGFRPRSRFDADSQAGFAPDIISSDVHVLCVDGPAYDNLVTMSKFLCLGRDPTEIVRAVTATPARQLNRPDLADLAPGSTADATVLRIEDGQFIFTDVLKRTMTGRQGFAVDRVVVGGRLWHTAN
jgi:dihydroorotase